jgi:hypothetical protein
MADTKISALPAATLPLAGTELVPIVQSGTTKNVAVNQLNIAPSFSAFQSSGQAFVALTNTKVQFQSENWDTASCFDSTTNYRFTPNLAGYYQVNATATLAGASYSIIRIFKNGAVWKESRTQGDISVSVCCQVYLNGTTDYIETYLELVSGGSTVATSDFTYFQGSLIRNG